MREVNSLGVTSVIDAGGGFQNYPDDYAVVEDLHRRREEALTPGSERSIARQHERDGFRALN